MPNPWEMNWAQQANAPQMPTPNVKPWEHKWEATSHMPPAPSLDAPITQEQHPQISATDRMLIKNLSISPQVGVEYLKKKYPDLDAKVYQGEIIAKKPGEDKYRVLDPDTGFFSSDFLPDVGDIAFDTTKGILTGAATAAGTAAGNLPGGMAAGGASSAALELLRQKLGAALGLPQPDVDWKQIAMEGGFGAAMAPAQAAGSAAYNFATRSVLPKLGSMSSGVPSNVLKDYLNNAPRVTELEQNPDKFLGLVSDAQDQIISGIQNKVQSTGKAIGDVLSKAEEAGKTVDISTIKQALSDRIAAAERAVFKNPTDASSAKLSDLKQIQDHYFTQKIPNPSNPQEIATQEIPNIVSPQTAFDLKQQLKELAKPNLAPNAVSKLKNPADKEVMTFGKEAMGKITSEVNKVAPEQLPSLNQNYGNLSETFDDTLKNFGTKQQTLNTLRNMDSNAKKVLQQRLNQTLNGDEQARLKDTLQAIQTQSYMANPASLPISNLGSTSTSRTIPLSTLGGSVGTLAGYKLGGGYAPAALGGALGASIGSAVGSPKAVGLGLKALGGAENIAGKLPTGPALYGAGQNAWEALQRQYLNQQPPQQ